MSLTAVAAAFTLAVISTSTPAFIALIVPLGALYLWIQRYYLRTSRELKRLDSISRSPIYAHFQESLSGISTIRAYRQTKRFALENEWRIDANLRAYFPSISANRWLAVRLEFIGSVVILAAAGFAVISVATGSGLSAGIVGLSMSYALQITASLNWIVRQTVEVETNIVSVERVLEYARLPPEAPEIISKHRPPVSWPSKGAVSFNGYSTRYRPGLDLVLKNINLSIKSHEKVGVVGRTGAGKSSLTLALFRIIEPVEGDVTIDDLSTSSIGLLDLRRRLAIIPQDAALFEGTVRDNLDPGHIHDDTELWSVLDHARLRDHVASMTGQLDAQIHEGGSNLSQGQRQLVSLARALLTPSNILVLDEATAAVDVETDAMLQTTLRSNMFKDRTIITSKYCVGLTKSMMTTPANTRQSRTVSTRSSTAIESWYWITARSRSSTLPPNSFDARGCSTSLCANLGSWDRSKELRKFGRTGCMYTCKKGLPSELINFETHLGAYTGSSSLEYSVNLDPSLPRLLTSRLRWRALINLPLRQYYIMHVCTASYVPALNTVFHVQWANEGNLCGPRLLGRGVRGMSSPACVTSALIRLLWTMWRAAMRAGARSPGNTSYSLHWLTCKKIGDG